MFKNSMVAAVMGLTLAAQPVADASAAVYAVQNVPRAQYVAVELVQFGPDQRPHGPGPRVAPGPRAYPGWKGQPGWQGAPAWRGPPGWAGRPYWYGRPWVRRPYYGTIFAGVALGTLITVAAVGAVPPRPHPNLCWYWADPYGTSGYWDYC